MALKGLLICVFLGVIATTMAVSLERSDSAIRPVAEEAATEVVTQDPPSETTGNPPSKTSVVRGYDRIKNAEFETTAKTTNFFLDSILQPKLLSSLDLSFVNRTIADPESVTQDELVEFLTSSEFVLYGLGYSILATISVLLLIFMPLIGLCVCFCRTCCWKCGGKTDPRDGKNSECARSCCGTLLLLFIAALATGCVFMFASSFAIKDVLSDPNESIFDNVASAFDTLDGYLTTTVNEVEDATKGNYDVTQQSIEKTLDNLAQGAFDTIEAETNATLYLNQLISATDSFPDLKTNLESAQGFIDALQTENNQLSVSLEDIKTSIDTNLGDCDSDPQCEQIKAELVYLTVANDFTSMNFAQEISEIEAVITQDLGSDLQKGLDEYDNIQTKIETDLQLEIAEAKSQMDSVGTEIDDVVADFQKHVDEIDIAGVSQSVRDVVSDPDYQEISGYVFYTLIGLSALVAFIVLCYLLGLLHGVCCRRPRAESESCCTRKCGATWLLAGIGLTFVFFFVLGLVSLVMMLVGGPFHTEVCRYVVEPDSSAPEVWSLLNNAINTHVQGPDSRNLNIDLVDIYTNCKEDKSLFETYDIETLLDINLDEILDTSAIDQELEKLKGKTFSFSVDMISPDLSGKLVAVSSEIDSIGTDSESYMESLKESAVKLNLAEFIQLLQTQGATLDYEVASLEALNPSITELESKTASLNTTLVAILDIVQPMSISDWATGLGKAQTELDTNGEAFIGEYIDGTVDGIMNEVSTLTTTIKHQVEHEIGRTYPVYSVYANLVDVACVDSIYALNGFWFGLGWCLFFLICAMITGFQLAGLYRKTKPYKKPGRTPSQVTRNKGSEPKRNSRKVYNAYEEGEEIQVVGSNQVLYRPTDPGMVMADNPVYYTPVTAMERKPSRNAGGVLVYPTAPPPYHVHRQQPYYQDDHRV